MTPSHHHILITPAEAFLLFNVGMLTGVTTAFLVVVLLGG